MQESAGAEYKDWQRDASLGAVLGSGGAAGRGALTRPWARGRGQASCDSCAARPSVIHPTLLALTNPILLTCIATPRCETGVCCCRYLQIQAGRCMQSPK